MLWRFQGKTTCKFDATDLACGVESGLGPREASCGGLRPRAAFLNRVLYEQAQVLMLPRSRCAFCRLGGTAGRSGREGQQARTNTAPSLPGAPRFGTHLGYQGAFGAVAAFASAWK